MYNLSEKTMSRIDNYNKYLKSRSSEDIFSNLINTGKSKELFEVWKLLKARKNNRTSESELTLRYYNRPYFYPDYKETENSIDRTYGDHLACYRELLLV